MGVEASFVYRWCIEAYKENYFLRSPFFKVSVPRNDGVWKLSEWHMVKHEKFDLVYLCLGLHERLSFLTIKCTFFVLDNTGKILLTAKAPFVAKLFKRKSEIRAQFPNYEINRCLQDGSLSVEVKATIYFDQVKMSVNTQYSQLKDLFEDKLFADVTIKCGDESFGAHKVILASRSPVFRKMLEVDMKEKSSNVIEIVDIDPPVMSDLLAYLYTGTAPNMKETAKDLLYAANKYEIPELCDMCEVMLQSELNDTNIVDTLILADLYNASDLKVACFSYIEDSAGAVLKSNEWKYLQQNHDKHSALLMEALEYIAS